MRFKTWRRPFEPKSRRSESMAMAGLGWYQGWRQTSMIRPNDLLDHARSLVSNAAAMVVDRALTLHANPSAPMKKEARSGGPLVDFAPSDAGLVAALGLFNELQTLRDQADYDHDATFEKVTYGTACSSADLAQRLLNDATPRAGRRS